MERLICITFAAVVIASSVIVLIAVTWHLGLSGSQFYRVSLPFVLVVCAVFLVLIASMGTYFLRLARKLEEMHRVAMTDHLTGVANRTALTETLQGDLVQAALSDGHLAVLSLDLDDFKKLNDEYGHHAGDAALKAAAERISHSVRRYEKVFRMGGDEFLCLIFDPDPKTAAQRVVDRLKTSFSTPMELGGHVQRVTPSIGIAIADRGETWDAVLKRSDAAMYKAKQSEFLYRFCTNAYPALVETEPLKTG